MQYAKSEFKSSCQSFLLFIKVYKECKAWLNSAEFKEKYKNNPFPPYLNPSLVDYSQINPNLAWDLNLPVPPKKYDFLYFTNGVSASAVTSLFLKKCDVNIIGSDFRCKEYYKAFFKKTDKTKNVIGIGGMIIRCRHYDDAYDLRKNNIQHLLSMFPKNLPFFYIARDPISRIRCVLNHVYDMEESFVRKFNLSFPYEQIIPKQTYWGNKDDTRPSFGLLLNDPFFFCGNKKWFIDFWHIVLDTDSIFKNFKDNIGPVCCVEFNDLKPTKIIETFEKIATFFNLTMPENKEMFKNRIWNEMYNFLPTTLYTHPEDLRKTEASEESLDKEGGFNIIITLPSHLKEEEKSLMDISNEIEENLMRDETRILMLIKENDLKNLKENTPLYQRTIQFLKGYVDAIQNEIERRKSVVFKEEDVLEFFKNNKEQRLFIKNILDSELNYIKQNHPDYIARWKYYLAFEKLCADLDGNEK